MLDVTYWSIFAAIAMVATAVTAKVNEIFKIEKDWAKQLMSWGVAIALTFLAWGINILPALDHPEWLFVLIQGVCVGLCSNGIYDIEVIKKLYDIIFKRRNE